LSHLGQEVATNWRHYQAPCFSGNCGPKFWEKLILFKIADTDAMRDVGTNDPVYNDRD
jgi:hypothetical protein